MRRLPRICRINPWPSRKERDRDRANGNAEANSRTPRPNVATARKTDQHHANEAHDYSGCFPDVSLRHRATHNEAERD
jgi:hypothetical protein